MVVHLVSESRRAFAVVPFESAKGKRAAIGENYLPPLKTVIDGPDQYDFVFVGFPTWDMKLPPPMKSSCISTVSGERQSFRSTPMADMARGAPLRPCGNCIRKALCCRASLLGEDWKEMDSFLPSKMPGRKKYARK